MTTDRERVKNIQKRLRGVNIIGCFAYPGGLSVVVMPHDASSPIRIEHIDRMDLSDCLIDKHGIANTVDCVMLNDLRRHQGGSR